MNGGEWDGNVDAVHTARLKELIVEHGWNALGQLGTEATQAIWLLVQHADAEPVFQEECLQAMQTQPEGRFGKSLLAYLEDRVRVNTGRPQLYGTQFYGDQNGFGPQPIEDREHLDERRAAVGLQPFAEYEAQMHSMYARTSAHN